MMRCAACNRKLTQAAGFIGLLPLGPVCFARIKPSKPGKPRSKRAKAERVTESQIELEFGETEWHV